MTSLLDIGPLTEDVSVGGGHSVTVYGMSPEGFFHLLTKFPSLQELMGGAKEVSWDTLREIAPESIAYALALTTTSRSYLTHQQWTDIVDATANVAVNLPAHAQMALFQSAMRLTFPEGIGPFMKRVQDLADSINRVSGVTVSDTKSSKPSRTGFATDSRGMRLGPAARPGSSVH